MKGSCEGSVGRCPLWVFWVFLRKVGVDFGCWWGHKLLIVNFSKRNLAATPVLNFWQGLERCYLLNLCNYIYIYKSSTSNICPEFFIRILYKHFAGIERLWYYKNKNNQACHSV